MGGIKKLTSIFLTKKAFKKFLAYGLLAIILYVFKDFLGVFLLTFVFAYLFYSVGKYLLKRIRGLSTKFSSLRFLTKTPFWLVIVFEYIVFIGLIIYLTSNIIPTIKVEIQSMVDEVSVIADFKGNSVEKYDRIGESGSVKIIRGLNDFRSSILTKLIIIDPEDNLKLTEYIEDFGKDLDFKAIGTTVVNNLSSIGSVILKIILAIVLSFIFIIDRKKMGNYLYKIQSSNFGFLYKEYSLLLDKVVKSFGLILKAQSLIALVNSVLTVIGLTIIGFIFSTEEVQAFPYILTLGLVVFIFGFVPILGVILSSIPILLIAYVTYASPIVIFAIIGLIIVIHMIEAYYLNPKIVSRFLHLPVSLTFVILILSEHFFGLAGLLVGISIFYLTIGLLKDFNTMLDKKKKAKKGAVLKK